MRTTAKASHYNHSLVLNAARVKAGGTQIPRTIRKASK